jgi:hypothetical protein
LEEDVMVIEDRFAKSVPTGVWAKITSRMHGMFLARLNKVRVVYLLKVPDPAPMESQQHFGGPSYWMSNINLVTGVSVSLFDSFIAAEDVEIGEGIVI